MKWFVRANSQPPEETDTGELQPVDATDPQTGIPVSATQVGSLAAILNAAGAHEGDAEGSQTAENQVQLVVDDEPATTKALWRVAVIKITGWMLTAVFVGVLVLAWPLAWGGRFSWTVVSGHSMEPMFYTGDVTLAYKTKDYKVGDIIVYTVTFDDKTGAVIHRIKKVLPDGNFQTKGDNNNFIDPWVARPQNIRGEVIESFPGAAKYVGLIRSPLFWIVPLGLMVTWFLWPTPVLEEPGEDEDEDEDADADADADADPQVPEDASVKGI